MGDEGAPHGVVMLTVASGVYPSSCGIPVPPITAIWILPIKNLVAVPKNGMRIIGLWLKGNAVYVPVYFSGSVDVAIASPSSARKG